MYLLATPIRLDQPIALQGMWHVDGSDQRAAGSLTYSPVAGLMLTVRGVDAHRGGCLGARKGQLTIKGDIAPHDWFSGGRVTLFGCYLRRVRWHRGFATETWLVNQGFLGSTHLPGEDPTVRTIDVEFSCLTEWANLGLDFGYYELDETEADQIGVRFTPLQPTMSATVEGGLINLHFTSLTTESRTTVQFDARAHLEVILDPPVPLQEAMDRFIRPLENFLTLAAAQTNHVQTLHIGWIDDAKEEFGATLLYQPIRSSQNEAAWGPFHSGMFSLIDLENTFSERLAQWLQFYNEYRTVCDLTFSTLYTPREYVEARFLSLIQAIEGLHRQLPGSRKVRTPPEEYSATKKAILDSAPPQTYQLLTSLLGHGNQVTLRERLEDLLSSYADLLPDAAAPTSPAFAGRCAKIRNALAHHQPLQDRSQAEIDQASETLIGLLCVILLQNIGFSRDEIRRFAHQGPSY